MSIKILYREPQTSLKYFAVPASQGLGEGYSCLLKNNWDVSQTTLESNRGKRDVLFIILYDFLHSIYVFTLCIRKHSFECDRLPMQNKVQIRFQTHPTTIQPSLWSSPFFTATIKQ